MFVKVPHSVGVTTIVTVAVPACSLIAGDGEVLLGLNTKHWTVSLPSAGGMHCPESVVAETNRTLFGKLSLTMSKFGSPASKLTLMVKVRLFPTPTGSGLAVLDIEQPANTIGSSASSMILEMVLVFNPYRPLFSRALVQAFCS